MKTAALRAPDKNSLSGREFARDVIILNGVLLSRYECMYTCACTLSLRLSTNFISTISQTCLFYGFSIKKRRKTFAAKWTEFCARFIKVRARLCFIKFCRRGLVEFFGRTSPRDSLPPKAMKIIKILFVGAINFELN